MSHVSCFTAIFFLLPKLYKSSKHFVHIHHFSFICSTARIFPEEFHHGLFKDRTSSSFSDSICFSHGLGGGLGGGFGGGYGMGAPRPFAMGYQSSGGGAASFRNEQGDGSGGVRGSYGYRDAQGLYRMVEYSAGQGGFQAAVKTNEPGTDGKENPADVIMNVQPARQESRIGGWGAGGFGGMGGAGGFGGMGGFEAWEQDPITEEDKE
ncbi:uncharacterized protein CEXT_35271 [Caerostris extrusa]|uniref:Uncharacterized protein n=1 Tax=Caerostris extrusa TaxID=172846 RepID=A0AAV4NQU0_CAEEX|nr:uncharacterized protein CEXT_35271 [Caerostris extrusa]